MRILGKGSLASFLKICLDISYYVLLVGIGLAGIILLLSSFSDLGNNGTLSVPVSFQLDPAAFHVNSPALGVTSAKFESVQTNLVFPARRGPFLLGNLLLLCVFLTLALWGVIQLRHVFRAFRDGRPFLPENARRIRRVGFAVILGEVARALATYFDSYYAMTHFTASGIQFAAGFDLRIVALIHGLAILVIAEVFRMGSRLEEEQSLTI